MIRRLVAQIILLNSDLATLTDKIRYAISVVAALAPVAFILNVLQIWFNDNKRFAEFLITILILNALIGAIMHHKKGSFSFKSAIIKNGEMTAIAVVVYIVLEMLRYTVGDNIAGDGFRALIQTMTLLWPGSKIIKNAYILSNGKHPPEWLMRKMYNIEKNGDLNDFFSHKKTDTEKGFDDYKKKLDDEI